MENNHPNIIFGHAKLGDPLRRKGIFGSIVKYREYLVWGPYSQP